MAKKKTIVDKIKESAKDKPLLDRINSLEKSLATTKNQLSVEKSRNKTLIIENTKLQESHDALIEVGDAPVGRKIKKIPKSGRSISRDTAIIVMSDWHFEENIDPATVNGLNKYNPEIAKNRIDEVAKRSLLLLDGARSLAKIDNMVLACLGDFINGTIHEELEEDNFLGPTEAIEEIEENLVSLIDFYKKEAGVKHITIPTAVGNHGRTTRRMRVSTGYRHNWEYMAYKHLAKWYRNDPKVTFKVEEGYHNILPVQGHDVRFHHGENIRFAGGVGGLHIPLRKAIAQWNKSRPVKLDVLGHFHQFIDDWNYVVNGCLCGFNAYALSIKAEYQEPTQSFIVMNKERGKVQAVPIFCETVLPVAV